MADLTTREKMIYNLAVDTIKKSLADSIQGLKIGMIPEKVGKKRLELKLLVEIEFFDELISKITHQEEMGYDHSRDWEKALKIWKD